MFSREPRASAMFSREPRRAFRKNANLDNRNMTARELFQEGRLSEALASQQQAVLDRPADADARLLLGELLLFNGDFDSLSQHLVQLPANLPGMEDRSGRLSGANRRGTAAPTH